MPDPNKQRVFTMRIPGVDVPIHIGGLPVPTTPEEEAAQMQFLREELAKYLPEGMDIDDFELQLESSEHAPVAGPSISPQQQNYIDTMLHETSAVLIDMMVTIKGAHTDHACMHNMKVLMEFKQQTEQLSARMNKVVDAMNSVMENFVRASTENAPKNKED